MRIGLDLNPLNSQSLLRSFHRKESNVSIKFTITFSNSIAMYAKLPFYGHLHNNNSNYYGKYDMHTRNRSRGTSLFAYLLAGFPAQCRARVVVGACAPEQWKWVECGAITFSFSCARARYLPRYNKHRIPPISRSTKFHLFHCAISLHFSTRLFVESCVAYLVY